MRTALSRISDIRRSPLREPQVSRRHVATDRGNLLVSIEVQITVRFRRAALCRREPMPAARTDRDVFALLQFSGTHSEVAVRLVIIDAAFFVEHVIRRKRRERNPFISHYAPPFSLNLSSHASTSAATRSNCSPASFIAASASRSRVSDAFACVALKRS